MTGLLHLRGLLLRHHWQLQAGAALRQAAEYHDSAACTESDAFCAECHAERLGAVSAVPSAVSQDRDNVMLLPAHRTLPHSFSMLVF